MDKPAFPFSLLDRFTGQKVDRLPDEIIPSRYVALEPFRINGHGDISQGQVVTDDGSGLLRIQPARSTEGVVLGPFRVSGEGVTPEQQSEHHLAWNAIHAIAKKVSTKVVDITDVSPILPSELSTSISLNALERELDHILHAGHLRMISEQPRLDIRYDEQIMPVSRARRLAPKSLAHLAGHSVLWQKRTLSGIEPRSVLARVSEDDHTIYENRLYKRLIDRLERHLRLRIAEVKKILEVLNNYARLSMSEDITPRLLRSICTLWGKAFDKDDSEQPEHARRGCEEAQGKLEKMLRSIRSLKSRGLYAAIPSSVALPRQVRLTNILLHDPHYRHLVVLWNLLDREERSNHSTPQDRFAEQQQLQADYAQYVGLVIQHAIDCTGYTALAGPPNAGDVQTFNCAGQQIKLRREGDDWVLSRPCPPRPSASHQGKGHRRSRAISFTEQPDAPDELRFIATAWFGRTPDPNSAASPGRIICWPGSPDDGATAAVGRLPLSPLDLYVVERVGQVIDTWLLAPLLKGYGRSVGPLPASVLEFARNHPQEIVQDEKRHHHVVFMKPLDERQLDQLENSLQDAAPDMRQEAMLAARQSVMLAQLCSQLPGRQSGNDQYHKVECHADRRSARYTCQYRDCQCEWTLKRAGERGHEFRFRPKLKESPGNSADGFKMAGRAWLDIPAEQPSDD